MADTTATRFIKENDASPVVYGAVVAGGGQGSTYTLENRKTFTLSAAECRALPKPYPKWKLT